MPGLQNNHSHFHDAKQKLMNRDENIRKYILQLKQYYFCAVSNKMMKMQLTYHFYHLNIIFE